MGQQQRQALLGNLESRRNSKVVVLFLGDRANLETQVAFDVIPLLNDHLVRGSPSRKVDLVLYTRGGLTLAGWGIVNLIREFCEEFNVLIPSKALSAGTLIALGADHVYMSRMGQLSPIDPAVNSPHGPKIGVPGQPMQATLPISVEDVAGFLDLARNEAHLSDEDSMLRVFEQLSSHVNPLALGAVYRSREQIRMLARKLLQSRKTPIERIDQIIQILTRDLGSHDYLIGHNEARGLLGDQAAELEPDEAALLQQIHQEYVIMLQLYSPFNPETELGLEQEKTATFVRGAVESHGLTHLFKTTQVLSRTQVPQQPGIPVSIPGVVQRTISEGWTEDKAL